MAESNLAITENRQNYLSFLKTRLQENWRGRKVQILTSAVAAAGGTVAACTFWPLAVVVAGVGAAIFLHGIFRAPPPRIQPPLAPLLASDIPEERPREADPIDRIYTRFLGRSFNTDTAPPMEKDIFELLNCVGEHNVEDVGFLLEQFFFKYFHNIEPVAKGVYDLATLLNRQVNNRSRSLKNIQEIAVEYLPGIERVKPFYPSSHRLPEEEPRRANFLWKHLFIGGALLTSRFLLLQRAQPNDLLPSPISSEPLPWEAMLPYIQDSYLVDHEEKQIALKVPSQLEFCPFTSWKQISIPDLNPICFANATKPKEPLCSFSERPWMYAAKDLLQRAALWRGYFYEQIQGVYEGTYQKIDTGRNWWNGVNQRWKPTIQSIPSHLGRATHSLWNSTATLFKMDKSFTEKTEPTRVWWNGVNRKWKLAVRNALHTTLYYGAKKTFEHTYRLVQFVIDAFPQKEFPVVLWNPQCERPLPMSKALVPLSGPRRFVKIEPFLPKAEIPFKVAPAAPLSKALVVRKTPSDAKRNALEVIPPKEDEGWNLQIGLVGLLWFIGVMYEHLRQDDRRIEEELPPMEEEEQPPLEEEEPVSRQVRGLGGLYEGRLRPRPAPREFFRPS